MAKQIARLLKTNVMADIDVPAIAQFLQAQGQRGDSILAHINPKEAALLQKMGGAGTPNPVTGLPEFYSIDPDYAYGADYAPTASKQYIDTSGFEGVGQEFLGDFAAQQYANSAFPYELEGDNAEIGPYVDGKRIREFPGGMSATPYLSPASQAGRAPSYFDTTLEGIDAQQNLNRALNPNVGRIDIRNIPALAPNLTVPERDSAVTRGPASMRAREIADLELAREGAPATGVNRIAQALGLSGSDLARLGLAGLGVYQGVRASREAAEAGREARREQEALAQPYREQGQQLVAQAQRGELTAPAQQQLAALRARSAQAAAARGGGGAGAAQAEAQIEAFRQQLLQNQYDYGMKVSNIGDQIALGAIRTGLEADRYASTLANNYFQNMARVAVGMPGEGGR
jgi:hypothetical protein